MLKLSLRGTQHQPIPPQITYPFFGLGSVSTQDANYSQNVHESYSLCRLSAANKVLAAPKSVKPETSSLSQKVQSRIFP